MRGPIKIVLIIAGSIVLAGAVSTPFAVAGSGSAPVIVTNPASSPVPVTGSVNVGNLPTTQAVSGTVSVSNLPATQPVSGNVGIIGTPNVLAVPGAPSSPWAEAATGINAPAEIQVPAGKQLNIEALSVRLGVPPGTEVEAMIEVTTGGKAINFMVPAPYAAANSTFNFYVGALNVHLYADAGSVVRLYALAVGNTSKTAQLAVSGYLT